VKSVKLLLIAGVVAGTGMAPLSAASAASHPSMTPTGSTVPTATLTDPGKKAKDDFGIAVAESPTTVVVGAYATTSGTKTAVGTVYVYTKGTSGWPTTPTVTLHDPGEESGALFGQSVAISGSTIVVGAPGAVGTNGAAYVYTDGTSGWPTKPTATLTASGSGSLGLSVAISGSTIVAGAPNTDPPPGVKYNDSGTAYIYTEGTSGWSSAPTTTLLDAAGQNGDEFGYSVGVSGSTIVVGEPHDGGLGGAFIYTDGTTGWPTTPTASLPDPANNAADLFGYVVTISGGTVVVAGKYHTDGAAYIYSQSEAGSWPTTPTASLADPGGKAKDGFGYALAVSGSTLAVGAEGTSSGKGATYVYDMGTTSWPTTPTVTLSPLTGDHLFGVSVAVSGTTALVGELNGTAPGATYIYNL
jgi:hypothetical protein